MGVGRQKRRLPFVFCSNGFYHLVRPDKLELGPFLLGCDFPSVLSPTDAG